MRGERQAVGLEHPAVVGGFDLVRGPAVVEPRLDLDREPHDAPHDADVAYQPVPVGRRPVHDRHEVVHLAHPVRGQEPGDQDRRVGQVQLPGHVVVPVRRDLVEAAPVGVQQRREHAGRVEPGNAEPVERAVAGHQRRRLQVADQPVVGDVRVAVHDCLLTVVQVSGPPQPAQDIRLSRCSPTRIAFAMAVSAGFTAPMLGKKLVSTTYRLSSSWALQLTSSTEADGSAPNRQVPAWCAQPATGMLMSM